jgi:hypothetical protein
MISMKVAWNDISKGNVNFTRKYCHKKFSYGMISLTIISSAIAIILLLSNSIIIVTVIPMFIGAIFIAKTGLEFDRFRGFAMIGYVTGIFLLLTNIWPILLYVMFNTMGAW